MGENVLSLQEKGVKLICGEDYLKNIDEEYITVGGYTEKNKNPMNVTVRVKILNNKNGYDFISSDNAYVRGKVIME